MLPATASAPAPSPRPFPLRAIEATTAVFLLVGAIWVLVGAIAGTALLSTAGAPWTDMILDRRGVMASGQALSATPRNTRVNGRRVFALTYSYTDASGVARTGATVTTNRHLVAEAHLNAPFTIDYDPRDGQRTRVHGERASLVGIPGLLPFGIGTLGLVAIAIGASRARRMRDIYVHGQAAVATITATKATAIRINWQRVIRVDYVFQTVSGPTEGRTTSRRPPAIGAKIWVLYDEGHPRRNVPAN